MIVETIVEITNDNPDEVWAWCKRELGATLKSVVAYGTASDAYKIVVTVISVEAAAMVRMFWHSE